VDPENWVGRGKRGSGWSQMISLALEFEKHGSNSFLQVKWLQLFIFYPCLNGWIKSTNTRCLDDVCS
jgi:hypothetical protein